jgi:hypothetical protein
VWKDCIPSTGLVELPVLVSFRIWVYIPDAYRRQLSTGRIGAATVRKANMWDVSAKRPAKDFADLDPAINIARSAVTVAEDRNGLQQTNFKLPRTKSSLHGDSVYWAQLPHVRSRHLRAVPAPPPLSQ